MKKTLLLIAILFTTIYSANAQWSLININTGYNLTKVIFVNDSVGYIIGDSIYGLDLSGKLFKTTDRGITWTEMFWDLRGFTDIDFVSADTGFISATDGGTTKTLRTFNGGISWISVNNDAPNGPQHFISSTKGFATKNVAAGIELFETNDGALTWKSTTIISSSSAVQDLQFTNDSIGYVGGLYGPLMAQYNTQAQQINFIAAQTAAVRKLQFFNADTGYFAATETTFSLAQLYFTTDGGASLVGMFSMGQFGLSLSDEINSFHCYDLNHCMCATTTGNIIVGIGGNVWWLEATPSSAIYSIYTTPDFAIAVGENGTVLRRSYITGIENEIPVEAVITSYPNPASDFVIVESASTEKLNLLFYDVHGKLVHQVKQISNQTKIDLSNFKQGIYFIVAQNETGTIRKTFKVLRQQ